MLKKILLLIIISCSIFITTACKRPQAMVLFNSEPITRSNFLTNVNEFIAGKRIYYLFMTEKPLKTQFIRVRILKRDEKANMEPVKLAYSNDFSLYKDQIYYYNDYIVLYDPGYYCMLIYSKENLTRPLVIADFRVK